MTGGTPIGSHLYDADGNLYNDGTMTYEWDAANRLTAINEGGGLRTQFAFDGLGRCMQVVESSGGSVTSVKNLFWDGLQICEEKDVTKTVTKRYFDQGVQVSGSNEFYTRDHLGSIRELVDGTGTTILARYDYDPYGRRTKLSGNMDADFGFTGHYYHQASGLCLAPYRAYSASLGRWISRDPIGEEGGVNLYQYVRNAPVRWTDRRGTDVDDNAVNPNPDNVKVIKQTGDMLD